MPSNAQLEINKGKVNAIAQEMKASQGIVLVDYRGLNVSQDTELRNALRAAGVKYSVVKNTMLRFAVKELGFDGLEGSLFGPTAMATSAEDPVAPARVMSEFARKFEHLEIKAGVVNENVIDVPGVNALAELPPKDVLVAKMLGMMSVPMTGLVNVLNANIRGLAVALSAVAEKRAEQESAA